MTELSAFQRANLEKLARYLWDFPQRAFNMESFSQTYSHTPLTGCGSVGCAIGYGPAAKIAALEVDRWWDDYCTRVFCRYSSNEYTWCFHSDWAFDRVDNSPRGAAQRVLFLLRHGLPANWLGQMQGRLPLCYLNEPLDLVEPKREPLTGVVELVKAAV